MRFVLLLFLALVSSSCMMNDTAKLKAAKTCVIATAITDEADFHSLGFTTFGNKHERGTVPGLRKMTEEILRQELGRFYQIKAVVQVPDPGSVPMSKRKASYDAAMAGSRAKHQADLEIFVYPYSYYPYGIPRHLEAEGFGFYTGGLTGGGTVVCYQGLSIRDGTTGAEVASPSGENDFGIIPDADTFSKERYQNPSARPLALAGPKSGGGYATMTPAQRGQLTQAFRELYRAKVRNDLWKMELR